jgi:pyruvate dehydrogenase E2 component (dihydrolipoamide acetyltransferase)
MPELTMPRLSDSMEEGVIIEWLASDGEAVEVGADIAEIETDKAVMVFQSEFAGTLTIDAQAGETVAVGARIGAVLAPGEAGPVAVGVGASGAELGATGAGDSPSDIAVSLPAPPESGQNGATHPASGAAAVRIQASPVARRIAASLNVDLTALSGSGPAGRVVKRDVLASSETTAVRVANLATPPAPVTVPAPVTTAAPAPPAPPATPSRIGVPAGERSGTDGGRGRVEVTQPTRVQATIARRMVEAKSTMPEFTLETVVDMDGAKALRSEFKALDGQLVPSFNDFVVRAAALALRAHPWANGAYRDGVFEHYSRVNVGVAVAVPGSLVVPTVFDADRCSLGEISRETRRLAAAARSGELTAAELTGGTFSVSNLGMFGVTRFTAVLNAPQAAILAVGGVEEVPVVRAGELVVGARMAITLTCDHRMLYGADAAAFLAEIRANLEAPLRLAL